jgi:hypothetical protein
MDKIRVLRLLVIADILVTAIGIVLGLTLERFLPEPLRLYLDAEMNAPIGPSEIAFLVLAIPFAMAIIVAWIGLLRGWKHAPTLYLLATTGMILAEVLSGPTIMTSFQAALDSASSILSGLIIGMLYLPGAGESYRLSGMRSHARSA